MEEEENKVLDIQFIKVENVNDPLFSDGCNDVSKYSEASFIEKSIKGKLCDESTDTYKTENGFVVFGEEENENTNNEINTVYIKEEPVFPEDVKVENEITNINEYSDLEDTKDTKENIVVCPYVYTDMTSTRTAYNRTMEKQPDKPEDFMNEPLPSMRKLMEVQDAVASTLAKPFVQPIIAASNSKAQKQHEYRQRIAASRTPAQAAAARKSQNERQRKNRLCQRQHVQQQSTTTADQPKSKAQRQREYRQRIAASRTPAQAAAARKSQNERQRKNRLRQQITNRLQQITNRLHVQQQSTTTADQPKSKAQRQREYRQRIAASRTPAQAAAARKSENERKRKNRLRKRLHAQQQSTTTADQPYEHVNLTNEPFFLVIPVPMEVQEAVASTSTPFAETIIAARKTRTRIQREYKQRIAASKTPAQAAAAREACNVNDPLFSDGCNDVSKYSEASFIEKSIKEKLCDESTDTYKTENDSVVFVEDENENTNNDINTVYIKEEPVFPEDVKVDNEITNINEYSNLEDTKDTKENIVVCPDVHADVVSTSVYEDGNPHCSTDTYGRDTTFLLGQDRVTRNEENDKALFLLGASSVDTRTFLKEADDHGYVKLKRSYRRRGSLKYSTKET